MVEQSSMKKRILIPIILLSFLIVENVLAHQPRIVTGEGIVQIENPDISQAFYGELMGQPAYFEINSAQPLEFYIGLLVPDIVGIDKDVSAKVYSEQKVEEKELFILDGINHDWTYYFEEFAGDSYYQGPEKEIDLEKGKYIIEVFSNDNKGKYVLVVGKKEEFPIQEIIKTILLLPSLKKNFFNKSPFTAYFNLIGVFLLVFILIIVGVAVLIFFLVKRIRRKKF